MRRRPRGRLHRWGATGLFPREARTCSACGLVASPHARGWRLEPPGADPDFAVRLPSCPGAPGRRETA